MVEKDNKLHTWGIIKASLGQIMDEAWVRSWYSGELADDLLARGTTATMETREDIGEVAIIVIPMRGIKSE